MIYKSSPFNLLPSRESTHETSDDYQPSLPFSGSTLPPRSILATPQSTTPHKKKTVSPLASAASCLRSAFVAHDSRIFSSGTRFLRGTKRAGVSAGVNTWSGMSQRWSTFGGCGAAHNRTCCVVLTGNTTWLNFKTIHREQGSWQMNSSARRSRHNWACHRQRSPSLRCPKNSFDTPKKWSSSWGVAMCRVLRVRASAPDIHRSWIPLGDPVCGVFMI